ncbi:pre-mrna-splicing factor 38b [Trichoderma cornu-damae]|uniref:Pre-mrna-splicing factor 38b n=1 Tax=Trichoderma cornu-damae TaxID=654480 RepID=A0A9P8TS82_9HYPO|nr:pre-mrna-splicing factor 38b [Trichoderma cornu-damae]
MPNHALLTDDYVADLLAKEANDCSLKYSAMGMEAFNTKYKPSTVPKPNTRFLRNIIKETDTHNKALLAKEAAESRERLKGLERAEGVKRRKTDPTAGDIRKRQLGNIQSILGGPRHRRGENTKPAADEERSRAKSGGDRHSHRSSRRERDVSAGGRQSRKDFGRLSRSPDSDGQRTHHEDDSRGSRRRHRDGSSEDKRRHARHRRRDRSRSPRSRHRSRSPRTKRSKHRSRSPLAAEKRPSNGSHRGDDGDESDPLEDFIGPAPPPTHRGRGTVAGSASLDRRFSDSYDPSADVPPDKGEGTWDDAVEAFRDRQKLRQMQEERMRAAGFADHQIQRINNSQREKTEADVVWSKVGEKREWDRGKEEDGQEDGDDMVLRGILSEEL